MILVVCLDDNNGMLYNKRRQSQDELLIKHLLELFSSQKIWMDSYSAALFAHATNQINVADLPMAIAAKGEPCFVEKGNISKYEEQIEKVIVYRWNRHYPSDVTFPIPLPSKSWKLVKTSEFAGSSHDVIREEIYTK